MNSKNPSKVTMSRASIRSGGSNRSKYNQSRVSVRDSRRTVITISDQKLEDEKSRKNLKKPRELVKITDDNNNITPQSLWLGNKPAEKALKKSKKKKITDSCLENTVSASTVLSSKLNSSLAVPYASELFGTLKTNPLGPEGSDFMSLASTLYQGGINSGSRLLPSLTSQSNIFSSEKKDSSYGSGSESSKFELNQLAQIDSSMKLNERSSILLHPSDSRTTQSSQQTNFIEDLRSETTVTQKHKPKTPGMLTEEDLENYAEIFFQIFTFFKILNF